MAKSLSCSPIKLEENRGRRKEGGRKEEGMWKRAVRIGRDTEQH